MVGSHGKAVSIVGDRMVGIALAFAVLELGGSDAFVVLSDADGLSQRDVDMVRAIESYL